VSKEKGWQNGKQRYKAYCAHHSGKLFDRGSGGHGTHRLTYKERRKARLRKDACERCGWREARCDLHLIIPGGPYTAENTITLCPNCHRVETEGARPQDGSGGGDSNILPGGPFFHRRSILALCARSHYSSQPSRW